MYITTPHASSQQGWTDSVSDNRSPGWIETPLSQGQRALWFLQQFSPQSPAYNIVHTVTLPVETDLAALERAYELLIARHAALRTTFAISDGEPVQRVHDNEFVGGFRVLEAGTWSEDLLDEKIKQEVYKPFDFQKGPLTRITIFAHAAQGDHIAILSQHHIITDMWSLAMLMHDLGELYTAEITGQPSTLKPVSAEYSDFVREQQLLTGEYEKQHLEFWREKLSGDLPVLDLITDHPRPAVNSAQGSSASIRLSADLVKGLKNLSQQQGATLYSTLLTGYYLLLQRYTGQKEIIVGSPKARRSRRQAKTLGYFVNPIALRIELSGDPSVAEFLSRVTETVRQAGAHEAYPFPLLVEKLQLSRDFSRSPVFQVMFSWQKTTKAVNRSQMTSFALNEKGCGLNLGALYVESLKLPYIVSPLDFTLLVAEADDEIVVTMEYSTDLFNAHTIQRLLSHYERLLGEMVDHPQSRISELRMMSDAEHEQILNWGGKASTENEKYHCLHHLFEAQVRRTPEKTAVEFDESHLTYQQLNDRASVIAESLRRHGTVIENIVGVCVERSLEMVTGMLGTLKAGAAYLPIDPAYPTERIDYLLRDSRVRVMLTQSHLASRFHSKDVEIICLDSVPEKSNFESGTLQETKPENLAYVIYTSGSTGNPKGVMVEHRSAANLVMEQTGAFHISEESRILQFASMSFDASVSEVFTALLSGATLVLARREQLLSPELLAKFIRDKRISVVTLPPTLWAAIPADEMPDLKTAVSAGEACSVEVASKWSYGRHFINAYGPTEATVGPTCYEISGQKMLCGFVPIGRPIRNMRVYVLDENQQPVSAGIRGEICLGGVGVARGYLNRPELTAGAFIDWNGDAETGRQRLYRTGDMGCWLPDGTLQYIGRTDGQVKLRGFRIETGEVEAVLQQRSDVGEALAVVREDQPGDKRLVAYVTGQNGKILTPVELKKYLQDRLPEYLVPATVMVLKSMPLTPNGKVDRKALPAPWGQRSVTGTAAYVMPRTSVEAAVATVWQSVLGIEKAGVNDNFFDLGGHSLLMAKVHSRLQEMFHLEMSLVEMFRHPTISAMAEYLSQKRDERTGSSRQQQPAQDRAAQQKAAIERQQQRHRILSNKPMATDSV